MAKLVGVPCAVGKLIQLPTLSSYIVITNDILRKAVQQVLNGTISDKGVLAPMSPRINNPLIKELKEKYG